MSRKDELKTAISAMRNELSEIEHQERVEQNQKYVDRFYKVRNNYSCPKDESDYWWVYLRVESCDEGGFLKGLQFQVDRYGKINIEMNNNITTILLYEEIESSEFYKEWDSLIGKIDRLGG